MSNTPTTISIDNVEYVRADSVGITDGDIKIAVLDRGFVYVGRIEWKDGFLIITGAKNIRVWGTKNGLGELVKGPTPSTKLDAVGTVRVLNHAVISLIDVEQEKWKGI